MVPLASNLFRIYGGESDGGAANILNVCHRLQMERVDATLDSTKMIDYQPPRNRPTENFVRYPMCVVILAVDAQNSVTLAVRGRPQPAGDAHIDGDLAEDSCFNVMLNRVVGGSVLTEALIVHSAHSALLGDTLALFNGTRCRLLHGGQTSSEGVRGPGAFQCGRGIFCGQVYHLTKLTYYLIMSYLIGLVVLVALVASLTRLATTDEISAPWRVRVRAWSGEFGFFARLIECDRCTAVWIAPLPTGAYLWNFVGNQPSWGIIDGLGAWIPMSLGIAYLSYLLILRGEK
jgi:hypothetical protein